MSKAFIKESDGDDDQDPPERLTENVPNYVTPLGYSALKNELDSLVKEERPKIVEIVRWAAGNGDRSENGDYIYGKRRLREIDRRVRYLIKRLESAKIIDPQLQQNLDKVYFGATVTYSEEGQTTKTVKIVGIDEADLEKEKISWISPVAKALLKAQVGDVVQLNVPSGKISLSIKAIKYLE